MSPMPKILALGLLGGLLLGLAACATAQAPDAPDAPDAGSGEERTIYVGPELVECTGVGPQMCMQIKESPEDDWQLFYDQIEGFDYEPGYDYELVVRVEDVENPPADASSLRYTLVEEVSKTPAE